MRHMDGTIANSQTIIELACSLGVAADKIRIAHPVPPYWRNVSTRLNITFPAHAIWNRYDRHTA